MPIATNPLSGQVTVADNLVKGDTFDKYQLVVEDLENTTRDFTGTTARILLQQCGTTVYQNNSPTLDFSTLGQVSHNLNLVPSITSTFDLGSIRGEMEFTFPFQTGGEDTVKTCFKFDLKVIEDLI
jgi:hypothetical protein